MEPGSREPTYSDDVRGPFWDQALAAGAGHAGMVATGETMPDDAGPHEATDNLRRYARWQWRDFWRNRGAWLALGALLAVGLLATFVNWVAAGYARGGEIALADIPARVSALVESLTHASFILGGAAAALLGVSGIVSRERERGLQRFLFAKPVRPVRYYLQLLAVNSVGALSILVGAVLLTAALLGPAVHIGTVLAVGVGAYILTAGVTFLISTLVRFDGAIAAAWLLAGFPVLAAAENGIPSMRALVWLFPQGPAAAIVHAVGADRIPQVSPHTVWIIGALVILLAVVYGLLGLLGGITVLRRRSIST